MAVKYVTQPACPVKLRNAVYNHFIDLDPTVGEATALARSSQQIRAEFGSLCLASGKVAIPAEHVEKFLHVFFPQHFDSKPQVIISTTDLSFDWLESRNWLSGLLKLVTIMHRYSRLKISWFKDITTIISILESMDIRKLKKMISVEYDICSLSKNFQNRPLPRLGAFLSITIKAAALDIDYFRLEFSREYGAIDIRFAWASRLYSEGETSESSSGDEDGSDGEEESSDAGDEEEDGDEDAPDSSEGCVESSG
ncbi:hypothetical protein J4E81_005946 [Alternaria sp. BMP 2799]|nr:hypothetical protein J4E81_005946 [Alternaria sp. BMP 2799]